ncbi:hypothetical protein COOONC_15891, partial [Cooperia oncophora]
MLATCEDDRPALEVLTKPRLAHSMWARPTAVRSEPLKSLSLVSKARAKGKRKIRRRTLCSRNVHSAFNQSISQPSEAIFETMETKMTGVQRSATWNPTSARVCSVLREEQIRRTPVMGIKAEARRLSYIKNRQIRRNQSTLSRRSIHRGKKTWFRRKPQPQMRNSMDENNLQRQHQSTAQWART